MSREKDTRDIKDSRVVNAWHVAGDGKSTSERDVKSDPLKELCSEIELRNRIKVARIQNENPESPHGLSLEARYARRAGRGD